MKSEKLLEDCSSIMARTIRNEFDKKLSYESLMNAHNLSKRGKGYRKEIIQFNLKKRRIYNVVI